MSKEDKFKSLLRSPSGSYETKEEIITPISSHADELVQVSGKKRTNLEFDAELHRWLKTHCASKGKSMVDVVEELLRRYREEIDG